MKEKISIERARMRLKISIPKAAPSQAYGELTEMLRRQDAIFESKDTSGAQVLSTCLLRGSALERGTVWRGGIG